MFCTKCGVENVNEASFCKNCGQPLKAQEKKSPGGLASTLKSFSSKLKLINKKLLYIIIPVVVVAAGLIVYFGIKPGFSTSYADKSKYPILYSKDSELYIVDSSSTSKLKISDNFPKDTDDYYNNLNSLTRQSSDGQVVTFIGDYNSEKYKGDLYVREAGKISQKAASDVYPYHLVSNNGRYVLYIQDYNDDRSVGDLYLYNVDNMKKEKIANDVYPNGFSISPDGETVIFVQDFNNDKHTGDLFIKINGKDKQRIDTEVALPISVSNSGETLTFIRFSEDDSNPDLYIKEKGKDVERLASVISNVLISQDCKNFVILSNYDSSKDVGDLYYKAELKDKDKVDSEVSNVLYNYDLVGRNLGNDVVFFSDNNIGKSLAYFKKNDSSYDLYMKIGDAKEKIFSNFENTYQLNLNISLDFKTVVFIGNYDSDTQSGDLYISKYEGGKINDREKIDSNVSSVQISEDGKYYYYMKDYKDQKGDLYIRETKDKSTKVASDVHRYSIGRDGKSCLFITEYNLDKQVGDLYIKDGSSEKKRLASDVFSYYTYDGKKIFFLKDYNIDKGQGDLFLVQDNKEAQKIDGDVRGLKLFNGFEEY